MIRPSPLVIAPAKLTLMPKFAGQETTNAALAGDPIPEVPTPEIRVLVTPSTLAAPLATKIVAKLVYAADPSVPFESDNCTVALPARVSNPRPSVKSVAEVLMNRVGVVPEIRVPGRPVTVPAVKAMVPEVPASMLIVPDSSVKLASMAITAVLPPADTVVVPPVVVSVAEDPPVIVVLLAPVTIAFPPEELRVALLALVTVAVLAEELIETAPDEDKVAVPLVVDSTTAPAVVVKLIAPLLVTSNAPGVMFTSAVVMLSEADGFSVTSAAEKVLPDATVVVDSGASVIDPSAAKVRRGLLFCCSTSGVSPGVRNVRPEPVDCRTLVLAFDSVSEELPVTVVLPPVILELVPVIVTVVDPPVSDASNTGVTTVAISREID